MADERHHDMLVRAELEDCLILRKETSPFLEFWGIADAREAAPAFRAATDASDPASGVASGTWSVGLPGPSAQA
jgi:hypothetical protein